MRLGLNKTLTSRRLLRLTLQVLAGAMVVLAITGYAAQTTISLGRVDVVQQTVDPSFFIPQICRDYGITSIVGYTPSNGNDLLIGTEGADYFDGSNGDDCIIGNGGNDILIGGNGNDVIVGGPGNDTISGGNQDDILFGGSGDDTLYGENGSDYLAGEGGSDALDGGKQIDTCVNDGVDILTDCEN